MAFFQQRLCQGDHAVDIVGGMGLEGGRQCIQRRHILAVFRGELGGNVINAAAPVAGRGNDLVVHIGNVTRVNHLRVLGLQQAKQYIKHHHRPRVADVRQIVHRGAADIQGDAVLL